MFLNLGRSWKVFNKQGVMMSRSDMMKRWNLEKDVSIVGKTICAGCGSAYHAEDIFLMCGKAETLVSAMGSCPSDVWAPKNPGLSMDEIRERIEKYEWI